MTEDSDDAWLHLQERWREVRFLLERTAEITEGARYALTISHDIASVRIDDMYSGRTSFLYAHHRAREGVLALNAGDLDRAQANLNAANHFLVDALMSKISRRDLRDLVTGAKTRGRRAGTGEKLERDRRLAAAVAMQRAAGLRGRAAFVAALRSDAWLAAECADMGYEALKKSEQRGRRSLDNNSN